MGAMSATAEPSLGNGVSRPLRKSKRRRPVSRRIVERCSTEPTSFACLSTAMAPETCGVAIDVPLRVAIPPPGIADVIDRPGARKSSRGDELEKLDTRKSASTEPTATASVTQAGQLIWLGSPALPDATTVATPRSWSSRIGSARALSSQAAGLVLPPTLRFTAAIGPSAN